MTLVEVVTGLAVFALIVLLVMIIVTASLNNIEKNSDLKKGIKSAAADIEYNLSGPVSDDDMLYEESEFSVDFGGTVVSVNGYYIKSENDRNQANFKYFVPD